MIHLPCDARDGLRARHAAYIEGPERECLPSPLDLRNRRNIEAWRQRRLKAAGDEFNRDVRDRGAPAGRVTGPVGGWLRWLWDGVVLALIDLVGPE
ncbi:MAG: hypothetical protein Q8N51_00735 [Gammaproteobacteria bacterium]|nr:hypothetical protein [Gammaproteobacteria bacterium]